MDCEIGLHEAFIELKQNICPFCKQPLEDEKKRDNIYMLFTSREVRIGKNCARGLGYRPRP